MYDIKFLESISNIKEVVKTSIDITLNTKKARDITACLQQGRLFFNAAKLSPLEIKPLLMYYGIVGFSKAIILSKTKEKLKTLHQTYGLSEYKSTSSNTIALLGLSFKGAGTFQHIHDIIVNVNDIYTFEDKTSNNKSLSTSRNLDRKTINLKNILSRIPGLEDLYKITFNEKPKTIKIHIGSDYRAIDLYHKALSITIPDKFTDINSLFNIINLLRKKHQFLQNWCLAYAQHIYRRA